MELTFLQKIVLLALNDQGWFGASEHRIKFGLAGAILFELYKKDRIRFQNDEIYVTNPKSTDNVVLDRVLNLIKSSDKRRSLRSWVQRIVNTKLLLRKTILKQLTEGKVISKEEYILMKVFHQTKFPLLNNEIKLKVQEDLYESIISEKELSDYDLMLLVVVNNCKMVRKNFGGFVQYAKMREKVNEIVQFKTQETETKVAIRLLQTAVSHSIMASGVPIYL
jgi:hypothetical protein